MTCIALRGERNGRQRGGSSPKMCQHETSGQRSSCELFFIQSLFWRRDRFTPDRRRCAPRNWQANVIRVLECDVILDVRCLSPAGALLRHDATCPQRYVSNPCFWNLSWTIPSALRFFKEGEPSSFTLLMHEAVTLFRQASRKSLWSKIRILRCHLALPKHQCHTVIAGRDNPALLPALHKS